MQLKLTSLLLCSILFLGACKKEKADPVAAAKQNLTSHNWKISSVALVTSSGEQPQTVQSCRADDVYEFKADGTFNLYPGTNLCTTGQGITTGTWELQNNATALKITVGNNFYTDEVKELSASRMRLAYVTGGNTYIETYVAN